MTVFLNGEFVAEEAATVSVFDRGFLYGDGLFETLLIWNSNPFRWQSHWKRFMAGAEFLGIRPPFESEAAFNFACELIGRNALPQALLRIHLSRGIGRRGYSPKGADRPNMVMSLHPATASEPGTPAQWRLLTSSLRLPAGDRLAQFKSTSKLPQVCARAEADASGADEALLLDTDGNVVEGASSNLFWMAGNTVYTPPIYGNLPGVTRAVVLELCAKTGFAVREMNVAPEVLPLAEGVFVSLTSVGVAEAVSLDGVGLNRTPAVTRLHSAYWELVVAETKETGLNQRGKAKS
jgi:aminodeoxychorismate lyase